MPAVLDASALLAFLFEEPGAERVEAEIGGARASTINWAETWQKLIDRGAPPEEGKAALLEAGLELVPLSVATAERAAGLRVAARATGLSLADRCCVSLASELGVPALTADGAWASLDLGVDVRVIR